MQNNLKLLLLALCVPSFALAQTVAGNEETSQAELQASSGADESQFTFTESQLGEDDDMAQNVTIISSNADLFAAQSGYGFSAVRFRYCALNQKYNDVYINGLQANDMESGQFRFSVVGGLNNMTRSAESVLPFEANNFSLTGAAGSNNYNFRAGSMPAGHRASLLMTNRNYNLRAMYTYASGFNSKGWAWAGNITYRGSTYEMSKLNPYYKGTFYNSLSYFLGVEKLIGDSHSLSFATWGNPTERASQGAGTEEMYWIANSHYYNPYWGYQNGKIRNSRVVNDFAPSAILTWDWQINDITKLTTSVGGRYSMYKNTSLDYNNSDNPQPDYWKNMPSAYYNVWDQESVRNNAYTPTEWQATYDYLTADEANRQINWDRLYAANQGTNALGAEAMYFVKAKHNNTLNLQFNTALNTEIDPMKHLTVGFGAGANRSRKFMSIDDLLGATNMHNLNSYAISTYGERADEVQYDLNNPSYIGDKATNLREGDKYRYDYFINHHKATLWAAYTAKARRVHLLVGGRTTYTDMQRDGQMRNGLAKENSYGKSGTAHFLDGGAKTSLSWNIGGGHALSAGLGMETRAPQASTAFAAPEINNDFVKNLHNEQVFTSELRYQMRSSWLNLNINAYYNHMNHVTEWQNYYFDDNNSFTYVSMTGIAKENYGVEAGLKLKLHSTLDFKAFGTISDAKYMNNCQARYMVSKRAEYVETKVYSKGMRESGTPLTAASVGLSYHNSGWYIDLSANYYDRIYLSWSPSLRYESVIPKRQSAGDILFDNDGNLLPDAFAQTEGKGGWMVDASIGRNIRLKKGSVSINLSLSNLLNNTSLVTGGYEQSRTDYTKNNQGGYDKRVYLFSKNPKLYYALGTNGMLNITWKF